MLQEVGFNFSAWRCPVYYLYYTSGRNLTTSVADSLWEFYKKNIILVIETYIVILS